MMRQEQLELYMAYFEGQMISLKADSVSNLMEWPANLQKDNHLDSLYGLSVTTVYGKMFYRCYTI